MTKKEKPMQNIKTMKKIVPTMEKEKYTKNPEEKAKNIENYRKIDKIY